MIRLRNTFAATIVAASKVLATVELPFGSDKQTLIWKYIVRVQGLQINKLKDMLITSLWIYKLVFHNQMQGLLL